MKPRLAIGPDAGGPTRHAAQRPTLSWLQEVGRAGPKQYAEATEGGANLAGRLILINSDTLGGPDRDLGGVLMEIFLRNLGNRPDLPECIVLLNAGVQLATHSSPVIDHLRKLAERGVRVVSCRTCVEYFKLEDKIGVGEVQGMVGILELLSTHEVLTV